jgi:ribonuclease PH
VDMNFVMTGAGLFIEVQGTAEHMPFSLGQMNRMTALATEGIARIIALQKQIVGEIRS